MTVYVLTQDEYILGIYESIDLIEEEYPDLEFEQSAFECFETRSLNGISYQIESFELREAEK